MKGSAPLVRPVRPEDFDEILALAQRTGGGMTNLPPEPHALRARIDKACASFATDAREPGGEVYVLAMEIGGRVVGTSAVFSAIGLGSGFVNYKVVWTFHASEQLDKRIRRRLLVPTHDFTGCAEVGSLFLAEEARGGGLGKFLARSRYLFIAQKPEIIADPVCAELRGWRAPDGSQPFWDALGAKFFEMEFEDADVHNAANGNQFIADLMPRHPIYVCLLPDAARECIGKPHESAAPAYAMLKREGFSFDHYIDIFDGGPLVSAKQADIATVRDSRLGTAVLADPAGGAEFLVAVGEGAGFRATRGLAVAGDDALIVGDAVASALGLEGGETVRYVA